VFWKLNSFQSFDLSNSYIALLISVKLLI